MKFSIIVPAFNEATHIENCLGHLSAALGANARADVDSELIVVDNNSTDAFRELSGFDQTLFAGEDVEFGRAMRRWAKPRGLNVAILRRSPPVTSIRKVDLYGSREIFLLILRWLLFPRRTGRDKARLGVFYDGRR